MKNVNIIGISGKHGSGKDTVALILQLLPFMPDDNALLRALNDPKIVANVQDTSQWKIKKFASKLKEIASILTGIPVEKFEDQEFKNSRLGPEWFETKPYIKGVANTSNSMTVRTFLQKLGTDAMRIGLHENTWVNALAADYEPGCKWLVTDVRFKNEAKMLKEVGALLIRVDRNVDTGDHPSEVDLDDYKFDVVLDNSGSILNLVKQVRALYQILNK